MPPSLIFRKRNKFGAVATVVDGIRFDSKREAQYWGTLRMRERLGEIKDLQRQVKFGLTVNGQHVADYKADFTYFDVARECRIVADVKGHETPEFKLKSKLMKACHGITIEIVK